MGVGEKARGSAARSPFGSALNGSAVWSPDGTRIVFRSNQRGLVELWQKSTAGGGEDELTLASEAIRVAGVSLNTGMPTHWSPDGMEGLCAFSGGAARFYLWPLPTNG